MGKSIIHIAEILIAILLLPCLGYCKENKVLIIGIDGCRPDALIAANTPNLDKLIADGAFTSIAQTRPVTSSGPGWSNMLTGVWQNKHGVNDNSFSNSKFDIFPHFFDRIKAHDPSLYCASIVRWEPIESRIPKIANLDLAIASSDEEVASAAADYIKNTSDLDVIFIHLDDVDHAGHQYGYHPGNADYLAYIQKTDILVGKIVTSLNQRSNIEEENWLIIVSTDHGGINKSHGGASDEERSIFLIVSGDDAAKIKIEDVDLKIKTGEQDIGKALVLDGIGYGKVVNNDFDVSVFEDFTIEAIVKSNGWEGDPAIVSDKNWISGNNKGMVLAGRSDGRTWKFNIGNGTDRIDLNGGDISDGEWHHIAVSFDRDGDKVLYQDGVLASTTNTMLTGIYSSGLAFGLGQDGTLKYPYTFGGDIAEIRIWNKALPHETIADHTCSSIDEHPDLKFLQVHWLFETLQDGMIDDRSANDYKLSLTNSLQLTVGNNSINCYEFNETTNIVDVAVTALVHMGVPINPDWQLDGVPFGLKSNPDHPNENFVYHFANPNDGRFKIDFPTEESLIYRISVGSISGKIIIPLHIQQGKSAYIDISTSAEGIYIITIQTIFGTEKRKFVLNKEL